MLKSMLQKKLSVGKFGMPLWILGLTGGMMAAAAGTAVGPVLAGSVTGTLGATISQTVVASAIANPSGADDFVGVVNDEGTSFTAAIETQVGENETILLTLDNASGEDANALLELNVPAGLDVELEGGLEEAQLSQSRWLMVVPDGGSTVTITLEPKDDLKPGFYTITGRVIQIAG